MQPSLARDGAGALGALREARALNQPFALLISDAHMPGMDGFALVAEMRKYEGLNVPVIMLLTSGAFRLDATRCRELGVAAYFTKPASGAELHAALLSIVEPTLQKTESATERLANLHSLREAIEPKALRVLLAEDDRVNQRVALRFLEKHGHSVRLVEDGWQALAALEAEAFDIVLMDVQMPGLDGLEVASIIRKKEAKTGGHQPMVAITAHALTGDKERCLAAGMDGYVSKPVHDKDLMEAIDRCSGAPVQSLTSLV